MFEIRTKPKISIVIPSWFTKGQHGRHGENEVFEIAYKCLKRLVFDILDNKDQKESFELIIINNGSDLQWEYTPKSDRDNLRERIGLYWSQADILIENEKNLGFSPAMNQGLNIARGKYIIAMNNDIFCWPGFLEAMLRPFRQEEVDKHPELSSPVGLVMPNVIKKEFQKDCLNEGGKLDMEKVFALKKEEIHLRNREIYEQRAEFGSCWCAKKELLDKCDLKKFEFDTRKYNK